MDKEPFTAELNDQPGYQRLLPGTPQTHGLKSGKVNLAPGADCGVHSTENKEEMLLFLAGTGVATLAQDNDIEVEKGKVLYIPPQTEHNIKNTGTEPLVYIFCVAPVSQ